MKRFLFLLSAICIFSAIVICILAIWDYMDSDVAFKSLATIGVILIGAMAYSAAREQLHEKSGAGDESEWRKKPHI
jgi:NADH:ubiquinone oxidoreductase subunit 4 (subunit M)